MSSLDSGLAWQRVDDRRHGPSLVAPLDRSEPSPDEDRIDRNVEHLTACAQGRLVVLGCREIRSGDEPTVILAAPTGTSLDELIDGPDEVPLDEVYRIGRDIFAVALAAHRHRPPVHLGPISKRGVFTGDDRLEVASLVPPSWGPADDRRAVARLVRDLVGDREAPEDVTRLLAVIDGLGPAGVGLADGFSATADGAPAGRTTDGSNGDADTSAAGAADRDPAAEGDDRAGADGPRRSDREGDNRRVAPDDDPGLGTRLVKAAIPAAVVAVVVGGYLLVTGADGEPAEQATAEIETASTVAGSPSPAGDGPQAGGAAPEGPTAPPVEGEAASPSPLRPAGDGRVHDLAILADGRVVGVGDRPIQIHRWDVDGPTPTETADDRLAVAHAVTPLADGRLAVGGRGGVTVWVRGEEDPSVVIDHDDEVWSLAQLADGRLVTGHESGLVRVWNLAEPDEPEITYRGHRNGAGRRIAGVVALADDRIASAGSDGLRVWQPPVSQPGRNFEVTGGNHLVEGSVGALAVGPDGTIAVGVESEVRLVSPIGSVVDRHEVHAGAITAIAVADDGTVVSGDAGGTIWRWPPSSATPVAGPPRPAAVESIAMFGGGRYVVSSDDGSVVVIG